MDKMLEFHDPEAFVRGYGDIIKETDYSKIPIKKLVERYKLIQQHLSGHIKTSFEPEKIDEQSTQAFRALNAIRIELDKTSRRQELKENNIALETMEEKNL